MSVNELTDLEFCDLLKEVCQRLENETTYCTVVELPYTNCVIFIDNDNEVNNQIPKFGWMDFKIVAKPDTYKIMRLIIFMSIACIFCFFMGICTNEQPHPTANKAELSMAYPKVIRLDRATTYQATVSQCDSNPFSTADGSIINPNKYQRWVALSRDLLKRWGGQFDYGDSLNIYCERCPQFNGYWFVHDCMASRYKNSIDFLLEPKYNVPKLGRATDVIIILND